MAFVLSHQPRNRHLVGYADDGLLIVAHESEAGSTDPTFELHDGKLRLAHRVLVVPTLQQTSVLLREHGEPPRKREVVPKRLPAIFDNGP